MMRKTALLLIIGLLLLNFSGCTLVGYLFIPDMSPGLVEEARPENAEVLPDLERDISEIRMTILEREYIPSKYNEPYHNLSMMQIWYGYYSEGVWYDHPCENYDLIGLFEYREWKGWEAGIGSHLVKIGKYLLINVCVQVDPTEEYNVYDTLGTQIQEPFAQYNTYYSYVDENRQMRFYMEDHSHGYGYVAENPAWYSDPDVREKCFTRNEFPHRLYLVLDYESIPDDYELHFTITNHVSGSTEEHILTAEMIQQLIEG